MPESAHRQEAAKAVLEAQGRPIRRGVIGVIADDERMLLIRRALGVAKPGLWCFPGGHVAPRETPRDAIVREISEELGLTVQPIHRVGSIRVLDSRHVLAIWRVQWLGGDLRPAEAEVAEVRWFSPEAIRALPDGIESNERVLTLLGV
jgi:8-oxo-dGTP diphosphatase